MRLFALLAVLPGCFYFVGDDSGGDDCTIVERTAGAPIATAPLRNPETLTCESFGTGCDPACGPCPALAPEPTWGQCGSPCETLGPADCAADPGCRVVTDAACEISLNCLTNFVACFPVDRAADNTIDCFTADAWQCSRSNACTALHSNAPCPNDAECPRPFELCVREGTSPGRCHDMVTCRALPPECGSGKTPGVSNGCWTGACIPNDLCEP